METAPALVGAGADRLVVGSAIFESGDIEEAIKEKKRIDAEKEDARNAQDKRMKKILEEKKKRRKMISNVNSYNNDHNKFRVSAVSRIIDNLDKLIT